MLSLHTQAGNCHKEQFYFNWIIQSDQYCETQNRCCSTQPNENHVAISSEQRLYSLKLTQPNVAVSGIIINIFIGHHNYFIASLLDLSSAEGSNKPDVKNGLSLWSAGHLSLIVQGCPLLLLVNMRPVVSRTEYVGQ